MCASNVPGQRIHGHPAITRQLDYPPCAAICFQVTALRSEAQVFTDNRFRDIQNSVKHQVFRDSRYYYREENQFAP
ncbi:hypothetical protein HA38_19595 [Pantoea allii]|nr:hypothetical protein HA38_19595 [Pantoea allii]